MLVTFSIPAPEGSHFMPGCLDGQVGTWQQFAVPGLLPVRGQLVDAAVLPGGRQAQLTVSIPSRSQAAQAVSVAAGGGPGPFIVKDDGTAAPRYSLHLVPEGLAAKPESPAALT